MDLIIPIIQGFRKFKEGLGGEDLKSFRVKERMEGMGFNGKFKDLIIQESGVNFWAMGGMGVAIGGV